MAVCDDETSHPMRTRSRAPSRGEADAVPVPEPELQAWAIRANHATRFLAVAVVVVSVWELVAGGLMDPVAGRLLWLVPAIAALEALISGRDTPPCDGTSPRSTGRVRGVGFAGPGVWLARFGCVLAIVAGWCGFKTLLELLWIELRPTDPQAWSYRMAAWAVLLLLGVAIRRSSGRPAFGDPAGGRLERSGER